MLQGKAMNVVSLRIMIQPMKKLSRGGEMKLNFKKK